MNKLTCALFYLLMCCLPLQGDIIKTTQIEKVTQDVPENALILFNIAEVLMDTEISLGTQAWRKYLRIRVNPQLHDELTLYVFKHVAPKAPESQIAAIIAHLQEQGFPVLAFTSRGRHEWYSSQIENIDQLTEESLHKIGIDFSLTRLPSELAQLDSLFSEYYHDGIIYATNTYEKGELLTRLLTETHYSPSRIIFVDDKVDSLKTVEASAEKMGIPFTGYAYSRTAHDHADFDPMIAHIQLDWLISYGQILSDQEASLIKEDQFQDMDSEIYFFNLIKKWKALKQQ